MAVPFQKVLYLPGQGSESPNAFLLASGSKVVAFSAVDGSFLSEWIAGDDRDLNFVDSQVVDVSNQLDDGIQEPPLKRRKKSSGADSDASSAEIVTENGTMRRRRPKAKPAKLPSVIHMCGSTDGRYAIVATGEDKCVRVLEVAKGRQLRTLNQRVLPKKVSAMILTTDQRTILCADKFGDVYGLPLHVPTISLQDRALETMAADDGETSNNSFMECPKPAASFLTVHTKKNIDTLRKQLSQAKVMTKKKKRDQGLRPLLGHVSLLTDVAYVTVTTGDKLRSFIISSDRDEHIRISRGLPQAHIIEGFCLGHTQFVNRLAIPQWNPNILVSGGGDDYLLSWDWMHGKILHRLDLRPSIDRLRKANNVAEGEPIAVSGLWTLPIGKEEGVLIIACEGVAALFICIVSEAGEFGSSQEVPLPSNILDVAIDPTQKLVVWTVDNIREPYSTRLHRQTRDDTCIGIHLWSEQTRSLEQLSSEPLIALVSQASQHAELPHDDSMVYHEEFLYSIEHLRKHAAHEAAEHIEHDVEDL